MHPSRTRRRTAAIVAAVCVAAAALPAAASARIVPGRSVAGIALGASSATVRASLGAPERGSTPMAYRYITSRGFGIYLIADRVFEIKVLRRPQATAAGVRVGSTLDAVRAAYPAATCTPAIVGRNAFECSLRGRAAGRGTETVFATTAGRVTSITIHFA